MEEISHSVTFFGKETLLFSLTTLTDCPHFYTTRFLGQLITQVL